MVSTTELIIKRMCRKCAEEHGLSDNVEYSNSKVEWLNVEASLGKILYLQVASDIRLQHGQMWSQWMYES